MSFLAQLGRAGAKRLAPSARVLYQTEQLRYYAEPAKSAAPAQDDDIVLASFKRQQQQFQQLMKGLENITIPLTGDDAAVKRYAQEVEGLKRRIGMPDVEEVINAELDYKFACSGYDVRRFVAHAVEGLDAAAVHEVLAAVEEAEAQSGRELDSENEKGWQILTAKMTDIERKYGLADKAKVKEEAVFEMYKKHIATLRQQVEEDINKVRASEHLEDIQPDLSSLQRPKLSAL